MEVDIDDDNDVNQSASHSGLNSFESFATPSHSSIRRTPNTISFQTPTKLLLNQARRSSSGFLFTSMFSARYRHLQKLHSEAFLGLNSVCLSALPVGAVFRSSLPATPVATPISRDSFTHFTEQAIRDRLCRTPSPRHGFVALALQERSQQQLQHQYLGVPHQFDPYSHQMDSHDSLSDVQPMDVSFATSPTLDEPLNEDDRDNDSANCSSYDEQQYYNNRRLFVGNISYRVTEKELIEFFRKFGKVKFCTLVRDHIKKRPKGFGFITFYKPNVAQSVLDCDPNQLVLDCRQLRVFPAKPKACKQMKRVANELKSERNESIKLRENLQSLEGFVIQNKKSSNNECTFNDLDDDTILHIFSFVHNLIDKTNLEFVCQRWNAIALNSWSSMKNIKFSDTFFSFDAPVITTKILFSILKKCPNMRSIDLKHVTKFMDTKALEIIAVSCPLLENIIYDGGPVTNIGLKHFSENCKNLKCVHMNECKDFSEKGFWYLLKNSHHLVELSVKNNYRITGKCFRVLSNIIRSIDISFCDKIGVDGFKELVRVDRPFMGQLSVSLVTTEIMRLICTKLITLKEFRIFSKVYDEFVTCLVLVYNMKDLEVLECRDQFEDLDDNGLFKIMQSCRKLRELVLTYSDKLTDISVAKLPNYCTELEHLCIRNSLITDESLIALSRLKRLKHLDINGCANISDNGVQVLIEFCNTLCFIDTNRCEQITHQCIKFAVQLQNSGVLFSELVISYNGVRMHTKKITVADVDTIILDREDFVYGDILPDDGYDADNDRFCEDNDSYENDFLENDDPVLAAEREWMS